MLRFAEYLELQDFRDRTIWQLLPGNEDSLGALRQGSRGVERSAVAGVLRALEAGPQMGA